jgi:uncharacterized protein (TIGR02145 family)
MRSTGTQFWQLFNEDATNETGFSGLPGGYRIAGQTDFFNLGYNGIWWSATASGSENAKYRGMSNTNGNVLLSGANLKLTGYSVRCVQDPDYGTVTGLDCDNAIHTGDIRNATTINVGVTTTLSYTGGNGGVYQAQTISSIGVTGLTATLEVGTFANGSGSLIFQITGKANTTGVASFLLNIGNQTCTFTRTVLAADPLASHTCGSTYVHNVSKTYGSLTDQQGNIYRTIQIGTQEWMAENLKTTIYRNGDPVSNVTDRLTWFESTTGAYCDFNNESGNDCPYGKLYNWYAASDNRNICPTGWHVPSESDWVDLQNQLGGIAVASVKLRSTGVQFWQFFNEGATNESGFSALPGGYRAAAPQLDFYNLGYNGFWWSSTSATSTLANYRGLSNINGNQLLTGATNKYFGHSVRCIKD